MELKPGYKQTKVGIIPEDWDIAPLEAYISFISYGFTNPMPTSESGVYMVTAKDINKGQIQLNSARHTTEVAYQTLLTAKSRPQKDDLLLTKDGSLGRVALVTDTIICINQSVALLRPNAKITPQFLKILLESPVYQSRMLEDAGGSTIKHIYITIVDQMLLGLPPKISEQRSIAAAFSDTDALLSSLDRLLAKKRDIKQAVMHQLLTGMQRLPGFSGEWESKRIGDIFDITAGSSKSKYIKDGGSYLIIDMGSVSTEGKLIPSKPTNYFGNFLKRGDLVMPKDDIGGGNIIGRVAYIDEDQRYVLGDHIYVLRVNQGNSLFLSYIINSNAINIALRKKVSGSAQLGLGRKSVEEQLIPFPLLAEQTAIAAVLSDMDAEIDALQQRQRKTRTVKQGMMQELLTGRTRLV